MTLDIRIVGYDGNERPMRMVAEVTTDNVTLIVRELRMAEIERATYLYALDVCGGGIRRAAAFLGIPRSTFAERVKRMGLVAVKAEVSE